MNRFLFTVESIIGCIVALVILLNYIPVRFSIITDKTQLIPQRDYSKSTSEIICIAPSIGDYLKQNHSVLTSDKWLPHRIITTKALVLPQNMYKFYGESHEPEIGNEDTSAIITVKKWDIIYPIQRTFPRALITPRSYLTVYDYNWSRILKTLIGKDR